MTDYVHIPNKGDKAPIIEMVIAINELLDEVRRLRKELSEHKGSARPHWEVED